MGLRNGASDRPARTPRGEYSDRHRHKAGVHELLNGRYPEADHGERKKYWPGEELLQQREVIAEALFRKMMEDKGAIIAHNGL